MGLVNPKERDKPVGGSLTALPRRIFSVAIGAGRQVRQGQTEATLETARTERRRWGWQRTVILPGGTNQVQYPRTPLTLRSVKKTQPIRLSFADFDELLAGANLIPKLFNNRRACEQLARFSKPQAKGAGFSQVIHNQPNAAARTGYPQHPTIYVM